MPETITTGVNEETSSLEQEWVAAEADLQLCMAEIYQDAVDFDVTDTFTSSSQTGAAPATRRKRAGAAAKTLLEKAHLLPHSKTVPRKPVDMLLGLLLRAMHAKFAVDSEYRKNIKNFTAQYVFKDRTAKICQVAHFKNGSMKVNSKEPEDPTFTLVFRDGKALLTLLFSPAPDVLNALLNQEVDFTGNINYLNKFAYMALLAKPRLDIVACQQHR